MKYTLLTNVQVLMCSLLISSLITMSIIGFSVFWDTRHLPQVIMKNNECEKVLNVENGHAFTCNDVNITLRRYRIKQ